MYKKITFIVLLLSMVPAWAQFGGAVAVKVAPVEKVEMAPVRKIPVTVEAKYVTTIKAESQGVIDTLTDVGQSLKQGEVIAVLIDTQAILRKQELHNAVTSDKARFDFLKSENARLKDLMKRNLVSNSALEQNESDLQASESELAQSQSRLNQYEDQMNKLTISAPYDGYVMQHFAQPGQLLNNGNNVVEFMSANDLQIEVNVPFAYRGQIQAGDSWQIETQSGEYIDAKVSRFAPAATGASHTIKVYLEATSGSLWPGEAVNVLVPVQARTEVIAVPRDALVIRRNEIYVFTVKEGKANKVNVVPGIAEGDMIEAKGMISASDTVVIRGNERLQPNADLKILE